MCRYALWPTCVLFRVGSLQRAEQQDHLASHLEYKMCIRYVVELKGIRILLNMNRIAIVQANWS